MKICRKSEVGQYISNQRLAVLARSVMCFFWAVAVISGKTIAAMMPMENIQMEGISITKDLRGTTVNGCVFAADGKPMPAMAIVLRLEDRKGKELGTVSIKVPAIPARGSEWVTGTNSIKYEDAVQVTLLGYFMTTKK